MRRLSWQSEATIMSAAPDLRFLQTRPLAIMFAILSKTYQGESQVLQRHLLQNARIMFACLTADELHFPMPSSPTGTVS